MLGLDLCSSDDGSPSSNARRYKYSITGAQAEHRHRHPHNLSERNEQIHPSVVVIVQVPDGRVLLGDGRTELIRDKHTQALPKKVRV